MDTEQIEKQEQIEAPGGQVETPTPDQPAEQPAEITAPSEEDEEYSAIIAEMGLDPDRKGRLSKRVKELVIEKKKAAAEAERLKDEQALLAQERDNWRKETLKLSGAAIQPQEIQVDTSDLPLPRREDFEDEDDYQDARAQRAATIAYRKENAKEQQRREVESITQRNVELESWVAQGRQKFPDFDIARRLPAQGGPAITPAMGQAIMSSELGHDVLYELGKNPAESLRIAYLHPIDQVMEIEKLAKRLAKPKTRTETNAPVANTPVGERGTVVNKEWQLTDPDIPFAEYEKIRMKQMRARMTGA